MSTKTDKFKQERGIRLIGSIESNNKDEADNLLKEGVDFGVNKSGDCPIHYAARKGSVDMLELLLRHGDNPNRANANKNTPLHLATREGHMTAVQFLKSKNVNLNPKNEDGDTPLHAAVIMHSMDFIERLVTLGMKVNEPNKKGQTPLHQAVMHNRPEAMEALLFKKANPIIKDKQGKTPADVAKTPTIETKLRTYAALKAAKDSGYITAQGTSVDPKKVMELKLDRVNVHITSIETKELLPFQLYCRREKTENSEIRFQSEDAEEAISDIFQLRVTDCIEVVSLEVSFPLYSPVKPQEQAILKMVDKPTENADHLVTKDGRMYSQLKLDMKPNTDEVFVMYTKPKVEQLSVSSEASVVQSQIDESFTLEVPKDAFSGETKLTLKMFESVATTSLPPRKKRKIDPKPGAVKENLRKMSLKDQPARKASIDNPTNKQPKQAQARKTIERPEKATEPGAQQALHELKPALLSNLYEINVTGDQPSKSVTVQCPALDKFKAVPESDIIIVTADENNLVDETSLKVAESEPKLVDGKFVFNASHFSTYVPVLRAVYQENPRDIFMQILSAKKREQPAVFFVMILEKIEGDYNNSIAVVEVVEAQRADARVDFWQKKGYTRQLFGESEAILTEPNQEFTIEISGNILVDGVESKRKVAFMPRRASSQPFRVCLDDLEGELTGEVRLVPVSKEGVTESFFDTSSRDVTLMFTLPSPPKLYNDNVSAAKFDPEQHIDLRDPILVHLKTLFFRYPWIDKKQEVALRAKCEALLKEFGILQPPVIMIKNTMTFCKKTFDKWREQVFNTLVHNESEVDTAALSLEDLSGYLLTDYVPPANDAANIVFAALLRSQAHSMDAFVLSTKGIIRQSDKSLPVSNSTFWRGYQQFLEVTKVTDPRDMAKLRALEMKNIEKYRNSKIK